MWALVAIETVYVHLLVGSMCAIGYCIMAAPAHASAVFPLLASSLMLLGILAWFAWWATDGIVDKDLLFYSEHRQKEKELQCLEYLKRQRRISKCPLFVLDLDLPPAQRWDVIIQHFLGRGDAQRVKILLIGIIIHNFGKIGGVVLTVLLRIILTAHVRFSLPSKYREELQGMARLTAPCGLSYFDLLLINYGGDFVSFIGKDGLSPQRAEHSCRGIAIVDELLGHLAVHLEIKKRNCLIIRSTTCAFFLGAFTASNLPNPSASSSRIISPTAYFSVSVQSQVSLNMLGYRTIGQYLARAVSSEVCHWPHLLLLRHSAEHASEFSGVQQRLVNWPLLSPCTFTVRDEVEDKETVLERDAGIRIQDNEQDNAIVKELD